MRWSIFSAFSLLLQLHHGRVVLSQLEPAAAATYADATITDSVVRSALETSTNNEAYVGNDSQIISKNYNEPKASSGQLSYLRRPEKQVPSDQINALGTVAPENNVAENIAPEYDTLPTPTIILVPLATTSVEIEYPTEPTADINLPFPVPIQARDRGTDVQKQICQSPEFQPSVLNWELSDAADFLEEFARANQDTEEYRRRGPLGLMAQQYIGLNDYRCGGYGQGRCYVSCPQVIASIDDLQTARRVNLILKSGHNLQLLTNVMTKFLDRAETEVGLLTGKISNELFWTEKSPDELMWETFMSVVSALVQAVLSSSGVFNYDLYLIWAQHARDREYMKLESLKTMIEQLRMHDGDVELIMEMERRAKAAETLYNAASAKLLKVIAAKPSEYDAMMQHVWWDGLIMPFVLGAGLGQIQEETMRFIAWENAERSPAVNQANLGEWLQNHCQNIRHRLVKSTDAIFEGQEPSSNNIDSNSLVETLRSGSLASLDSDMLRQWLSINRETEMKQMIIHQLVNAALGSQATWISCTQDTKAPNPRSNSFAVADEPVPTCNQDRSGPQDMKACVNDWIYGELTCYLYKLDARGHTNSVRVEKPWGWQLLADPPYNVTLPDIITSSVKTHLLQRRGFFPVIPGFTPGASTATFTNPAQPGLFNLPVCLSLDYNWMTPIEPNGLWAQLKCGLNPHCVKKNLPCYCGSWGNETQTVWKRTTLWQGGPDSKSSLKKQYRLRLCPRQAHERIKDPTEKEIAKCQLDIQKDSGIFTKNRYGRKETCSGALDCLEAAGFPEPKSTSNRLKANLACALGTGRREICPQGLQCSPEDAPRQPGELIYRM